MRQTTENLIERLAADVRPVRHLRPPLVRAGLWLASVAVIAMAVVMSFTDLTRFASRFNDASTMLETLAIVATAVTAVVAAFHLSLPDRSPAWVLAPLPPLGLWIATSGYGCYQFVATAGPNGWQIGIAFDCLRFILGTSVPLGVSLLLVLRRARPIAPGPVAAAAGLGVAAVAAFLLDFFHPVDVTVIDLVAHFLAVALVVGAASLSGRLAPQNAR